MVEAVGLAREDRAEVEAEAVDMHLARPIAQAVGDHLDHARMAEVERVSGAGVVDVVARLIGQQPIIGGVVDALERQRRAALVAFRGVVVDDVENHFEPGIVEARHHLLEFAQSLLALMRIARVGSKEADRVVAPVVGQALVEQVAVVDEGVDRQQLDRGDAERFDVVDYGLAAETREGAALRFWHLRDAAW